MSNLQKVSSGAKVYRALRAHQALVVQTGYIHEPAVAFIQCSELRRWEQDETTGWIPQVPRERSVERERAIWLPRRFPNLLRTLQTLETCVRTLLTPEQPNSGSNSAKNLF